MIATRMASPRDQIRQGFTLVELLVAMALTLFIMVILSQAFVAGAQTFSDLKSLGDLNKRLRTATSQMRADLRAVNFNNSSTTTLHSVPLPIDATSNGVGFFRVWQGQPTTTLSASIAAPGNFQAVTLSNPPASLTPPIQSGSCIVLDAVNQETVQVINVGPAAANPPHPALTPSQIEANLLYAHQTGAPVMLGEGIDNDNIPTIRTTNHNLHFLVNLNPLGQRREDYVAAVVGGSNPTYTPTPYVSPCGGYGPTAFRDSNGYLYHSQWGEVAYFLVANGATTPSGTPLYGLYRHQVAALDPSDLPALQTALNTTSPIPSPTAADTSNPKLYDAYYYQMSCKPSVNTPGQLFFNGPAELSIPELRYGMNNANLSAGMIPPTAAGPPPILIGPGGNYPRIGDSIPNLPTGYTWAGSWTDPGQPPTSVAGGDLVINDVVSFDIQVFDPQVYMFDFINLPPLPAPAGTAPYVNTVYQPNIRVYDTWRFDAGNVTPYNYSQGKPAAATGDGPTVMPLQATPTGYQATNLYGIQICIRIWDTRAQKTRQITLIQDT